MYDLRQQSPPRIRQKCTADHGGTFFTENTKAEPKLRFVYSTPKAYILFVVQYISIVNFYKLHAISGIFLIVFPDKIVSV